MIALLAADRDMLITERAKALEREQVVGAFRFLEAQNIRLIVAQKLLDQRHTQPNGIDVPGSNRKGHGKDSRLLTGRREPNHLSGKCKHAAHYNDDNYRPLRFMAMRW